MQAKKRMRVFKDLVFIIFIIAGLVSCKNETGYKQNDHVNMINRILTNDIVFSEPLLLNYDTTDIILENLFIVTDNFTDFNFYQSDSIFEVTYNNLIQYDPLLLQIFGNSISIDSFDPVEDFSLLIDSINQESIYDLVWSERINDTIRELDFESTLTKYNSTGFIMVSKPIFDSNCDTAIICMDILTRNHYINNMFFLRRDLDNWELIKKNYNVFKLIKFYTGIDKNNQITGKGFRFVILDIEGLNVYSLSEE